MKSGVDLTPGMPVQSSSRIGNYTSLGTEAARLYRLVGPATVGVEFGGLFVSAPLVILDKSFGEC